MNAECGVRSAECGRPLVCFALKEEATGFQEFAAGRAEVSILITGIGRENSRRTFLERLKQFTPDIVLTCGFAGGLDPKLAAGDLLFATDDSALREKLLAAGGIPGTFSCAPRIATTAMEKADLRRTTGADAVEMESEGIQDLCRERKIPCATVRVISDTAGEDLPLDFNQLSKADLSLDYGKLAWAIAKSPGKIPALLRLQKNTGLAAERLAGVLASVIGLR
jgi:adenosylhomocysteine nucleosidase